MITAKVVGSIWATRKSELLNGHRLMLVEVIGGKEAGKRMVAVDVIGAGVDTRVLVTTGGSARKMLGDNESPADAAIVGIIDDDCQFEE